MLGRPLPAVFDHRRDADFREIGSPRDNVGGGAGVVCTIHFDRFCTGAVRGRETREIKRRLQVKGISQMTVPSCLTEHGVTPNFYCNPTVFGWYLKRLCANPQCASAHLRMPGIVRLADEAAGTEIICVARMVCAVLRGSRVHIHAAHGIMGSSIAVLAHNVV